MTFHFTVRDDKQIRVIIDTDADCEADDPFAIAQALLTPKFMVKAICAEHFNEAGSMERSFRTASTVVQLLNSDVPVLEGARTPLAGRRYPSAVRTVPRRHHHRGRRHQAAPGNRQPDDHHLDRHAASRQR